MQEVKVGQWYEVAGQQCEFEVIAVTKTFASIRYASGFESDKSIGFIINYCKKIKDVEPAFSDLEIVQKALEKTGCELACVDGDWLLSILNSDDPEPIIIGATTALLAWAKQTIGIEN